MTPIEKAVAAIAPDYVLSETQIGAIHRHPRPAEQARILPALLRSMAESLVASCPVDFDWRLVPVEWMLDNVDFAVFRRSKMIGVNEIGSARGFLLGQIVGSADPIECAYLAVLGRPSEPEGHAYWQGQHEAGEPLSKIFWHIENSPEAKRKRAGG